MVLLAAVVDVPSGSAQSPAELRTQRERVREQQARVAAQIDVAMAEDDKIEAALAALDAHVTTEEALLRGAQSAVARAEQEVERAKTDERRVSGEVTGLEATIRDTAVRAFMGTAPPSDVLVQSSDLSERARRAVLFDAAFGRLEDLHDRLQSAREDLQIAREEAEAGLATAASRREEVARRVAEVAAARDQQATLAAEVELRIERQLSEAASLSQLDQQLSAEIVRRQEALARQNRAASGRVSGGTSTSGSVPTRSVNGIRVHVSIADQLAGLLAAAAADGIVLSGGGYRDSADQIRLRQAHCPDPESSPASSCRPPTARPGLSMHEQGLAIDFTYRGSVISSRSSPAFRWLAANASSYGLYNLPSEPWHWSTNGN